MYLSSKSSNPLTVPVATRGSALPIVIFFASIGMITVFTYLLHQFSFSRVPLRAPASLQAQLNARSGIYKAFYQLIDSTTSDTFKTISTLDSTFGASMFGDVSDSLLPEKNKPQFDGTPVVYTLFESDTPAVGDCEVSLEPAGGSFTLKSIGRYRAIERTVTATIGSRTPALADTVVVYRNKLPWEQLPYKGTIVAIEDGKQLNSDWFNQLTDRYINELSVSDTFLLDPPIIIQSSQDIKKIDTLVQGPLLIDGSHLSIVWKDTGTIIIKGDLQITGEVTIEGLTFVVAGEIKILDEAQLLGVNLITQSRLFIGDQAHFEGNALAMHSITVYGQASISGRSSLIAGSTRTVTSTKTSDSLKFSILLSESSTIDAVCIAIETPGSIKTDQETTITGILWAQHLVCHRGRMAGLICARRLVDCDNVEQMTDNSMSGIAPSPGDSGSAKPSATTPVTTRLQNSIPGQIEPLPEIYLYHLPFFIGRLSIVAWKEE